jgi:ABC-2 type transport system permease protein
MVGLTLAGQRQEPAPAPAGAGREPSWRGSRIPAQILVLTTRSLRALVVDPRMILTSLIAPLLMLVVFSQIFASVASAPGFPAGVRYIDFLVPAIMVNSVMQSLLQSGTRLALDMRDGIVARFRSLPIWLGSVLLGRSVADLVRSALQQLLLLAAAYALFGFRPAGGVPGVVGAWGLALVVGGALGWIFVALACWIRSVDLMQNVATLVTFPLMFASNAFVPVSGLPGWLQAVARLNPMSYGIDAARHLTFAEPAGTSASAAIGISVVVATTAAAIAIRGFRRPLDGRPGRALKRAGRSPAASRPARS